MGTKASEAIPHLEEVLSDAKEEVLIASARALGQIGRSAVSASTQLLELMDIASDRGKMAIQFALEKIQGK
jgi:HEAT repeat protein